jgi:hypothetical protein
MEDEVNDGLDIEVPQASGKPYGINWSQLNNGDKEVYRKLLQYFDPIELWKDYGEFLISERRDKEYYHHIFLEKESYLSVHLSIKEICNNLFSLEYMLHVLLEKGTYLSVFNEVKETYRIFASVDYVYRMSAGIGLILLSGFYYATTLDNDIKLMSIALFTIGVGLLAAGMTKKATLMFRNELNKRSTIQYEKQNLNIDKSENLSQEERSQEDYDRYGEIDLNKMDMNRLKFASTRTYLNGSVKTNI